MVTKYTGLVRLYILILLLWVCPVRGVEQTSIAADETSYAAVTEILAELNRLQAHMAELHARHEHFIRELQSLVPLPHERKDAELSLRRINETGDAGELKNIIENARRRHREQREENRRLRAELDKTTLWLQQAEDEFQNLAARRQTLLLRLEKALRGESKNTNAPKRP